MLAHTTSPSIGHHPQSDPGPATWLGGTTPQWLTLAATILAFGWAVFLYRRSVADKRIESPRLVYVMPRGDGAPTAFSTGARVSGMVRRIGGDISYVWNRESALLERVQLTTTKTVTQATEPISRFLVYLRNDSPEVITHVETLLVRPDGTTINDSDGPMIEYMGPKSEHLLGLFARSADAQIVFPLVMFTDGAGLRWIHQAGRPLELLPDWFDGKRSVWSDLGRLWNSLSRVRSAVWDYVRW